jgi:alpha-mannosidase
VDSFGHAGTLPQILRKCGFDDYVFMRPEPHEKDLPSQVFWWQGPDGSRILTYRIPAPYETGRLADYEPHLAQALAGMPAELNETMSFFGVGNHGGGPTGEQIEHLTTHAHPGSRPPIGSPGRLAAQELELTALKPAEDGTGFVVRIADMHGRGGSGQFIWQEQSFDITLAPFEIATWRLYHEVGRWHFIPCDMLERIPPPAAGRPPGHGPGGSAVKQDRRVTDPAWSLAFSE